MKTNHPHHDGEWTIGEIEKLTEASAQVISIEDMTIKGHAVYFVDFGGYFGYSALVFADGRHIHYANEYELHHRHSNLDRDALRKRFIGSLNSKLFTDAEIASPIKDYSDYYNRRQYLHSYYGMRRENVTIFKINPTDEEREEFKKQTAAMTYDPIAFGFYSDADFVRRHVQLFDEMEAAWARCQNDYDIMKGAFIWEMYNHEYAINYQGDWDVLSCFGNVRYIDCYTPEPYFDALGFTDVQRRAYIDARREYLAKVNDDAM